MNKQHAFKRLHVVVLMHHPQCHQQVYNYMPKDNLICAGSSEDKFSRDDCY